ncbi:hypothetical protein Nmel_014217 [Mimus melanotis]
MVRGWLSEDSGAGNEGNVRGGRGWGGKCPTAAENTTWQSQGWEERSKESPGSREEMLHVPEDKTGLRSSVQQLHWTHQIPAQPQ